MGQAYSRERARLCSLCYLQPNAWQNSPGLQALRNDNRSCRALALSDKAFHLAGTKAGKTLVLVELYVS